MRTVVQILAVFLLLVLVAVPAAADRVTLRNGSVMTGAITKESVDEIELSLTDGMKMTIRKSLITKIERQRETDPNDTGSDPVVPPDQNPVEPEPTPVDPDLPVDQIPDFATFADFFAHTPARAWGSQFSRYPVIMAAKTTPFRAYRYVHHSPLAVSPTDDRYVGIVRTHGHSGSISVWEFEYVGMRDLRYGDQVRFIGEITSPKDEETLLVRLKQGPSPYAERIAVFLVKRGNNIDRYVTTSVFNPTDFRRKDLDRLDEYTLNVRTYTTSFRPVNSIWMTPAESEFLSGLRSPFGDSVRVRLMRCRFQLNWFAMAPADRPPLDPDLLSRNVVKPLALPGRPVAEEALILRIWGSEAHVREKHNQLVELLREDLARVAVKPGRDYIVERERIGVLGKKGVSIETQRHDIPAKLLGELLTPK
jgi:hypothetical protein